MSKTTDIYVDTVRQCQRLLRLLHYCQQHYTYFTELYFHSLEHYIKSDNDKITAIVLQQIASHLFEGTNNENDYQRLIKYLPSSTTTIPSSHQSILTTIQTLLSTSKTETNFLSKHLDILYPYTACFLDVRREFRDTAHYFIDGDSLLLSIAHHVNVNLRSYYGNTLHVIYIIERLLLTLFHQSHRCNYSLIFFDCHYHLYQKENSILTLLRACLIAHLSKNGTANIQQFPSWLDENYLQFVRDEKPMFIFYHDMSTFDIDNDHLLSKDVLEKLLCIYRLFGNYHQYVIQCQLYLLNKLTLANTTVKCFRIQFNRMCPKKLLDDIVKTEASDTHINVTKEQNWSEYEENDVRIFLYLKTIGDFIEENQQEQQLVQRLSPLLILHVALLIRLSLLDRHLPSTFPSVTYSPIVSQLIVQFQQRLASNLSTYSSSRSWSKIADLFDGRLFTFTLEEIHQSLNIRLDSKTYESVKQALDILKIPVNENLFQDIVKQLIQSNDIIFSSEKPATTIIQQQNRQKIIRISNPFVDIYMRPILSRNDAVTFDLINPDESQIIQHRGKFFLSSDY